MGDGSTAIQYKVSQIILPTEVGAVDAISRLQNGEPFSKLAKEMSIDKATKSQGGAVGWIFASQILKPIADVMVSLDKGASSSVPIQMEGGWAIIKVEDKRTIKVPTFKEAKNQISQSLVQQYLQETVKKLRETAKVVQ